MASSLPLNAVAVVVVTVTILDLFVLFYVSVLFACLYVDHMCA